MTLWSLNQPSYPGLGAGMVDRRGLRIVAGPVPAADLNTPWTNAAFKRRGKLGTKLRRDDFKQMARRERINSQRPVRGLGLGDASAFGFAPLVVAGAVKGGISVARGITKVFGHPKDAGRLRTNAEIASRAAAGDATALAQLQQRSKGLATAKARNDAKKKYNALMNATTPRPNIVATPNIVAPAPTELQVAVASMPPIVQAAAKALTSGTAMDAALFSTPDVANTSAPAQAAVQVAQETVQDGRQAARAGMSPMTLALIAGGAFLLLGKRR